MNMVAVEFETRVGQLRWIRKVDDRLLIAYRRKDASSMSISDAENIIEEIRKGCRRVQMIIR